MNFPSNIMSADALGHRIRRLAKRLGFTAKKLKWSGDWYLCTSPDCGNFLASDDDNAYMNLVSRMIRESEENLAWATGIKKWMLAESEVSV